MGTVSQNSLETGKAFIKRLIIAFWLLVSIYIVSHWVLWSLPTASPPIGNNQAQQPSACFTEPAKAGTLSWQNFVSVAPNGEVRFHNHREMDWYVGADHVIELTEPLRAAETQTLELVAEIREILGRMNESGLIRPAAIKVLRGHIDAGQYIEARIAFETFWSTLSSETRGILDQNQPRVSGFGDKVESIRQLLIEQCDYASAFTPPSTKMFFWTSPSLAIVEVYFWALLGVLTNLFYNSAEHLRKGTFNPNERWVAYTKAHYGPVLAVILTLAMVFGWFKIESYEIRVWTLPLVGFIFGYVSRSTARLFENIVERFMGKAEEAARAGPEGARASTTRVLNVLMEATRPRNFEELRHDAKILAGEVVEKKLADKEKST